MNRRRFVLTSMSAAAVGAAAAAGCSRLGGAGNGLPGGLSSLFEGFSKASYTLTAQYATTNIAGYKLRTRTYNGKTFGPMLTVKPGQMLDVTIKNELPPNPKIKHPRKRFMLIPDVHDEMEAMNPHPKRFRLARVDFDKMNNPHDFNTTNLHVHGIQTIPHIFSPIGTSDPKAMMLAIEPGESFTYHLPVPDDHPSGLHWYHPHHHGATDVQVSGGMAGLIVVRGPIDEVPEIAKAREIFMVFQSLGVNRSKTDPNLYEREYEAYKPPQDGGYALETEFTMITTNGHGVSWVKNGDQPVHTPIPPPQFSVQPGEVVRLRMLSGFNHDPIPLILSGFDVWQIGFDGVNLLKPAVKHMDGKGISVLTPDNFIDAPVRMMMPGNRIELLIKAPDKPGMHRLSAMASKNLNGGELPTIDLAEFVVEGDPVTMAIPSDLPKPTREYPVITNPTDHKSFVYSVKEDDSLLTGLGFYVNDGLYREMEIPTAVKLNEEQEWRIENNSRALHPFHIHVNSFQLTAINDVPNDNVEIWDTFYVPPRTSRTDGKNGSITFRIRFVQFKGKSLHHCHILPHEDTGMMQNFLIE